MIARRYAFYKFVADFLSPTFLRCYIDLCGMLANKILNVAYRCLVTYSSFHGPVVKGLKF